MTEERLRVLKSPDLYGKEIKSLFDPPPRVVKRDVFSAIVDVQETLHAALKNGESIRQDAYNAGLEEAQRQTTQTLVEARREYESARANAEADAVDFAFALAAKIVGAEIERDPTTIVRVVGTLLESVRDRRQLVVLVNPSDLEQLQAHQTVLSDQIGGVPVHFEARADVTAGGCVIETATGRVDGQLETQLRVLRDGMESP